MLTQNTPPIAVGESDTNGALAQCLGQNYVRRNQSSTVAQGTLLGYKLVKNNSGGTLAAGDALVIQRTSGVENGSVTTTTTANDPDWAGIVPAEFGSNTIANGAYFLMQTMGPGRPKFAQTASNFTVTATGGSALGTATTAGYVQLIIGTASGTAAAVLNDVGAYITGNLFRARATNTTAVTAAGALGYADLFSP